MPLNQQLTFSKNNQNAKSINMKFLQEFLSRWYLPTFIAAILIAGLILNNYISEFKTIDISSFETGRLVGLFGSLFFISLLVERFIELFVQDPDAELKRRKAAQKKNLIDPNQIMEAELELKEMRKKRRNTVVFIGFVMGLIIALFGMRILTNLVVDPDWGDLQKRYVNILDMVLTAGLIAGGSEGIHSLINIAKNAMNPGSLAPPQ